MSLRQSLSRFALLGLLSALAACSVLPESETLRIFLLPTTPTPQQASEPTIQQTSKIGVILDPVASMEIRHHKP